MSGLAMRGQFSRFSGTGGSGSDYPDPFQDIASLSVPTNFKSALLWSEYIFSIFGTYRMASERKISYFLTDVEIMKASEDETEKWTNFLTNTLGVMVSMQSLLRDRDCYGNAFASVLVPFRRWLTCPGKSCGASFPLAEVYNKRQFRFEWNIPSFKATCPKCETRGVWAVDDREDDQESRIKIKRWSPHEIELLHDPYTDDVAYIWRIPEDYRQSVIKGHLYYLERAPMSVIEAIDNNEVFRFNEDAIFHMKEPTLSGVVNRGWGIPRVLTNFRQIYHVQVLRRYNEAIALDYLIPFRVITPAPAQGSTGRGGMSTDPLLMSNGSDFRAQVTAMTRRRMRDPGALQVLPFPVNFQMFGADAKQLAPTELLQQANDQLLNDSGTPVDLYNGTLQLQAAPVALRLYEATWRHLVHDSNSCLQWLVRQIGQIMSWEVVEARLKRVTIADNLDKQMMAAQMMMSQQLSGTTVFRDLGYNWRQEQKQMGEEAQFQAETQARVQEEMQTAGFAQQMAKGQAAAPPGAAPAGGAPPAPGGAPAGAPAGDPALGGAMGTTMQGPVSQYLQSMSPNVPVTPQDMMAVADSLAQELLGFPEGVKDSELRKLKQQNQALHALVKARMDQIRSDTKSQAGNAAVGQMQQGGGQPPPA